MVACALRRAATRRGTGREDRWIIVNKWLSRPPAIRRALRASGRNCSAISARAGIGAADHGEKPRCRAEFAALARSDASCSGVTCATARADTAMDNPSHVALSGQTGARAADGRAGQQHRQPVDHRLQGRADGVRGVSSPDKGGTPVAYVQDAGTVRDWSQGPLTRTGNALDVALQGAGFLEVQTAAGHALHPRRPPQARRSGPDRDARGRSRAGRRRTPDRGPAGHRRPSPSARTAPSTTPGRHDRQARRW